MFNVLKTLSTSTATFAPCTDRCLVRPPNDHSLTNKICINLLCSIDWPLASAPRRQQERAAASPPESDDEKAPGGNGQKSWTPNRLILKHLRPKPFSSGGAIDGHNLSDQGSIRTRGPTFSRPASSFLSSLICSNSLSNCSIGCRRGGASVFPITLSTRSGKCDFVTRSPATAFSLLGPRGRDRTLPQPRSVQSMGPSLRCTAQWSLIASCRLEPSGGSLRMLLRPQLLTRGCFNPQPMRK